MVGLCSRRKSRVAINLCSSSARSVTTRHTCQLRTTAQDEFLGQMFLLVVNTLLAAKSEAVCQPARPWSFRAAQIYAVRKTRCFQNDAKFTNSLLGKDSSQWHSPLAWWILGFQLQNLFQIRTKQLDTWYRAFLDKAITTKPAKKLTAFSENQRFNTAFSSSATGPHPETEHTLHPQSAVIYDIF